VLLLAAAVLALAPAPCSAATARAVILRQNVQIGLPSHGRIPVAPEQVDRVICADFTRDGRTDMAVTIASGGTAGDIAWLVFVRAPTSWRLVLNRSGYKLGLYRLGGDLADSQPVYVKGDPNCCPTGGFDHTRWHWNGTRFVVARHWHDKSFIASQ
jgi:hypothetical protein